MNTMKRKPPTAYAGKAVNNCPADRRIILATGRGEVRVTPAEAEQLACELFRVAREVKNENI